MNKIIIILFCSAIFSAYCSAESIPDSGQTKCYDVVGKEITCPSVNQPLYGQDSNRAINPMNYTKYFRKGVPLFDSVKSWNMIRDNVTGLFWEMKTNQDGFTNYLDPHDADNVYTWFDGNQSTNGGYGGTPGDGTDTEDFIRALNDSYFGGYNDWRLPTVKELATIVDYSVQSPNSSINANFFPNTQSHSFWSSSTFAQFSSFAWYVDFNQGQFNYNYRSSRLHARAVRSDASTASSYRDNGNNTVSDTSTGLIWQKVPPNTKMTWEQTLYYCEALNLGGYDDWRVPTIKELQSLIDYSNHIPSINESFFPNTNAETYWSSTTNTNYTNNACSVNFLYGYSDKDLKTNKLFFRPVRGGQSNPSEITQIGSQPGTTKITISAKQIVELVINSTNSHNDTPVYEWFFCASIQKSISSPIYLISDIGAVDYKQVISYLDTYIYSFNPSGLTSYAKLSMSDLGLSTGDQFIYAYCYQSHSNVKVMDNIVFITVK